MMNRSHLLLDAAALGDYFHATLPTPSPPEDPAALAARPSAVLIPLFAGPDGAPHLLFTQRASTLSRHSGEISFPGGRQDPDDIDLAATALREAQEEIGLDPVRARILGGLPPVFTIVSNYVIWPQLALVTGDAASIASRVNPAEVAGVIDAPLAALLDPAIVHTEEWIRNGMSRLIYFYQFGPHRIWGATAFILTDLLQRLPAS
jgi:8-oxo-dGTP pyrophosphatase MutT (NUDIX family)